MPKNKQKELRQRGFVIFVAIATIVSLAGFTGLFGLNATQQNDATTQDEEIDIGQIVALTGVPCLTSEEFHLHPRLTIKIDGAEEPLPANIGIYEGCTQELHTHGADGVIHVESDTDKGYTFQHFLNVWGLSLSQEGFIARLTVGGTFNDNDTSFKLEDGQEILLEFITIPSFGENATQ